MKLESDSLLTAFDHQVVLIDSLATLLAAAGHSVRRFETHISWVLVAGEYAFKVKKAVRFSFLDFSTLEARYFFCREELRLNSRFAADLYLDVVPITGSLEQPRIGEGEAGDIVLDYAVKMRAFDEECLWSRRIADSSIEAAEVDELASEIACFHRKAAKAPLETRWGRPDVLATIAEETFADLGMVSDRLPGLRAWEKARREHLNMAFQNRKKAGMVRECHGDLHCRNILTGPDGVRIFDCIEFDPGLRWIDVMNDVAFICMDLAFRGKRYLAFRLLNCYLEWTGDYGGLAVFRYYLAMRAIVRAKIVLLRSQQLDEHHDERVVCRHQYESLLAFGEQVAIGPRPILVLMVGVAGTGKTSLARLLAGMIDGIQLRSDVERKRLAGMAPNEHAAGQAAAELYSSDMTEKTYDRLLTLAQDLLHIGMPAIVDASFLQEAQRRRFAIAAQREGVGFFIVKAVAKIPILRGRITHRSASQRDASDADVSVLMRQLAEWEPLSAEELRYAFTIDTEIFPDATDMKVRCAPILAAVHGATLINRI